MNESPKLVFYGRLASSVEVRHYEPLLSCSPIGHPHGWLAHQRPSITTSRDATVPRNSGIHLNCKRTDGRSLFAGRLVERGHGDNHGTMDEKGGGGEPNGSKELAATLLYEVTGDLN